MCAVYQMRISEANDHQEFAMRSVLEMETEQGGYVASLGDTYNVTQSSLDALRSRHWLDARTVAVVFELAFYNVNVNLACLVLVLFEFPTAGGANIKSRSKAMRIFRTTHSFDVFIMVLELVYVFFTVYMIVREAKQIRKLKRDYISLLGFVNFFICVTSVAAITVYILISVQASRLIDLLSARREAMATLQTLASLETGLVLLSGLLLALGAIKLLRLVRFNPVFFRFMNAIKSAIPKIISCAFVIMTAYLSYGSFITLVFGHRIGIFSSMKTTLVTFYEGALGIIYIDEVRDAYPFWGPCLYLAFVMFSMYLFVNFIIILLIEATRSVRLTPRLSEDTQLVAMMFNKMSQWLAIRKPGRRAKHASGKQ